MNKKDERKSGSISARISDDDLETLNDLSEYTNKSRTDVVMRAFKFWVNVNDLSKIEETDEEKWGKVRKGNRIHVRALEEDMSQLTKCSEVTGLSVGQIIRRAIREYHNSLKGRY